MCWRKVFPEKCQMSAGPVHVTSGLGLDGFVRLLSEVTHHTTTLALEGFFRIPYGDDEPEDETPDYTPDSPDYTPDPMASPMAIPDDYFPLPDPSLDPSQLPALVVQPDHTLDGAIAATPIEIIYISDEYDEMDIDDTTAAAMDLEDVLLGEPKKEDPDDEEDPEEVEFYDDEE
ncbi:hypothetical protein GUJ93_ZPchr0015g6744 [Zizania palustris]|uniref:Uncharacterized protein n=1 Tax=Zizania palustris TaxID=103762 RepID=A0A8J5THG6_ZIZPA|nr:hypothetical protein GUJ93_ZPchr0015g6744 [Zizania palustris]